VGTAIAALSVSVGTALADPPASALPLPNTAIVAAGSDTIQFLADQFSTDYNATTPANPFYSYDAVNPSTGLPADTITTKGSATTPPAAANPCTITRPNGSGAGIAAVKAQVKTSDGVNYCIDVARASRNIKSSDGAGLTSVLIARDLITVSEPSGSNGSDVSLTSSDLTAIYECNASLIDPSFPDAPVTWDELGGQLSTDPIVPVLPQANSGTRQQFQTDITVSNAQLGSCVVNGASSVDGSTIEENEGNNSEFGASNPNNLDVVFPFSAGNYVCQVDTLKCPDAHGTQLLQDIDGTAPLNSDNTINVGGFSSAYVRGLYFVSLNAGTASKPAVPTSPIDLTKFLGQGNKTGFVCSTAGQNDVASFGFAKAGNSCGFLTGQ
jgi:ABC-type phosphate transport system substrate-binding protein